MTKYIIAKFDLGEPEQALLQHREWNSGLCTKNCTEREIETYYCSMMWWFMYKHDNLTDTSIQVLCNAKIFRFMC